MLVPVAVLAILVIMGLASRSLFGTANRPVFLVLLILVLLVMSGLRSETVGMDTQRYYASFNDFLAMDREEAAEFISTQKDAGYYWFSWAFGKVIPDVHVWFMFVSAVYLIGIALVCYWESPDYAFSMLYMYTMGMFFFSMTGLRQALAMGIALTSYAFLAKRQFIPFVIIVGVASIFHHRQSARRPPSRCRGSPCPARRRASRVPRAAAAAPSRAPRFPRRGCTDCPPRAAYQRKNVP